MDNSLPGTAYRIPTPVGGIPVDADRAPSVVFAIAWAALVPFVVLRFVLKRRRSFLLLGVCFVILDRIATFAVRAVQAYQPHRRTDRDMLAYLQTTFATGYVTLAVDSLVLVRTVLENARSSRAESDPESQLVAGSHSESKWRRVLMYFIVPLIFAPGSLGIAQGSTFKNAARLQRAANAVFGLRYAAAGCAMLLFTYMIAVALPLLMRLPNINRAAACRLLVVFTLAVVVNLYRLAVMKNTIPSLLSTDPSSLESTAHKTLFYVFHCLPEWLAAAVLIIPDTRAEFGIGDEKKQAGGTRAVDAMRTESGSVGGPYVEVIELQEGAVDAGPMRKA